MDREGDNPSLGLISCLQKNEAIARYALEKLPNKVMASKYRTTLSDETLFAAEIERTRRVLDPLGMRPADNAKSHLVKFRKSIRRRPESDS